LVDHLLLRLDHQLVFLERSAGDTNKDVAQDSIAMFAHCSRGLRLRDMQSWRSLTP
jgi:hypothetical protein